MKKLSHYWQTINLVSIALSPLSLLFCTMVFLRRFSYRIGLIQSRTSRLPVIVVGNIYIGGNGKTPFVIWLARQLKKAGYKPGVVSRGYGASDKKDDPGWPRQVNPDQDRQLFGDEPMLIYLSTQCPVIIDPVRSRAVKKLEQDTDCNVIISDDGLQHYAMSRTIEINITDARRLYGNGLCLPAGPLREGQSRLKSIDYLIYNISQQDLAAKNTGSNGQYGDHEFTMDYEFDALVPLSGKDFNASSEPLNQAMTLKDLKGKMVHAVAGIGEPDNFFRLLKKQGLILIEHPFSDHYQYQQKDLMFNESYPIIMTEKDAVKCCSFQLNECWYLPIQAKIDDTLVRFVVKKLEAKKLEAD